MDVWSNDKDCWVLSQILIDHLWESILKVTLFLEDIESATEFFLKIDFFFTIPSVFASELSFVRLSKYQIKLLRHLRISFPETSVSKILCSFFSLFSESSPEPSFSSSSEDNSFYDESKFFSSFLSMHFKSPKELLFPLKDTNPNLFIF